MGLPKIDLPLFTTTLPTTGETVTYRPFTVKEEKILLIARETKQMDQIVLATKQVINNCLVDKKLEELSMTDVEFLLLELRAQSIDAEMKFTIIDPDTQEHIELTLNTKDIKLHEFEDHTNKIKINDDFTLIMRYPNIEEVVLMLKGVEKSKIGLAEFEIVMRCMDKLVQGDSIYKFADFSEQEVQDFVDSLDPKTIKKIETFFKTIPTLRHEIPYKNSTGTEKTFVIQGIETFFI